MKSFLAVLILISVLLSITGCATRPKQEIHYSGGGIHKEWLQRKLEECRLESAVIVLSVFETRPWMTDEDVRNMDKKIMDSCVRYHKLDI